MISECLWLARQYFLLFLHNHLTAPLLYKTEVDLFETFPHVRLCKEEQRSQMFVCPPTNKGEAGYICHRAVLMVHPEHQPGAADSAALQGGTPDPTAICHHARICNICFQEKLQSIFLAYKKQVSLAQTPTYR